MHPLKNFYTPMSGAQQKCFKLGPALANAGHGNTLSEYLLVQRTFLFFCFGLFFP